MTTRHNLFAVVPEFGLSARGGHPGRWIVYMALGLHLALVGGCESLGLLWKQKEIAVEVDVQRIRSRGAPRLLDAIDGPIHLCDEFIVAEGIIRHPERYAGRTVVVHMECEATQSYGVRYVEESFWLFPPGPACLMLSPQDIPETGEIEIFDSQRVIDGCPDE